MLKVLIAEDSLILADILETFLEMGGYEVCGVAATVSEAVALADLHKPDLAVLDYRMANGEFGSAIRKRLKDKVTMGILYASGDPLDNKLTMEDGEAYIQKPYGLYDILQALSIVRAIKMKKNAYVLPFPANLRILKGPVDERRSA